MEDLLGLGAEEAKVYSTIVQAVSTLPKSDPRHALLSGITWWFVHRRRKMEQYRARRRVFYRRRRRLLLIREWLQNRISDHPSSLTFNEQNSDTALESVDSENPGDFNCVITNVVSLRSAIYDEFWSLVDSGDMPEETFRENFHMSKATFDFIYTELEEHLTKSNTSMREPLPAKKRLAATIYRMVTNAEYLKVSNMFSIGKSTTTSLIRDVCEVIVTHLRDKFLNLCSEEDQSLQVRENEEVFGIPQCIGVVGSVDVFILGTSSEWNESSPFTSMYSQTYGLIFQGVVNGSGLFTHVTAGTPAGCTNGDHLYRSQLESQMTEKFSHLATTLGDNVQVPVLLVADASYPCRPWLITPYPSEEADQDESKAELNSRIALACERFQEAMMAVKGRFRIFHGKNGKINFNADAFENIGVAACILHNICEKMGDSCDAVWKADLEQKSLFLRVKGDEDVECAVSTNLLDSAPAHSVRDALVTRIPFFKSS